MVSGASATWLGIGVAVGCWMASWWVKRDNPDRGEYTNIIRERERIFFDGCFFPNDWMLSSGFHGEDISYTMMVTHTQMVLDGFPFYFHHISVDSLMVTLPLEAPLQSQYKTHRFLTKSILEVVSLVVFFCWSYSVLTWQSMNLDNRHW